MATDAAAFPRLAEPGRIGPLALRNRMLLCPMGDNLAEPDGTVSHRQLDYYETRAAGGAALLLVGSVAIAYPDGATAEAQTGFSGERFRPGLQVLTERVHRHGAAIAAQLVHNGPNAVLDIARGKPLLVPSVPPRMQMDALSAMVPTEELTAMTEPFTRPGAAMHHRVATEEDLAILIDQFAVAAELAKQCGFDGVEIHAGHGYVIDAFLSPLTNRRTDRWGGSVAGRARLLTEVLRAIRTRVGQDLAVWCRLNAREVDKPGGETLDDAIAIAQLAVEAGAQAIHVTAYADPGQATGITAGHTPHTPGARLADAAAVKAKVGVPVITFGRLEPAAAEQALADGHADFVAFGRKLLAGPGLPAAIVAGTPEVARPCAYQYRCIGNIFLHRPLACAVGPDTTREAELAPGPTGRPRHVLVVGGGPVGMEAAHRLAQAGHRVTLWDAADRLGGTLRLAGAADPALGPLSQWLAGEVERSGVNVALAQEATLESVRRLGPDRVLLAVGAEWVRPDPPAQVVTPEDLWHDPARGLNGLGRRVVVVGSGKAAVSLAGAARARGSQVALVAPSPVLAPELGLPGRFRLVQDLRDAGVELHPGATIAHVGPGSVGLGDGADLEADTVLWAVDRQPRTRLFDELRTAGVTVDLLGDASGTFGLESGLLAAARTAAALGRVT